MVVRHDSVLNSVVFMVQKSNMLLFDILVALLDQDAQRSNVAQI